MSALDHVRYLADTIGPRGSTTPKEAEAARYAAKVLSSMGLEPTTESFTSALSAWYPYVVFTGLLLAGEILFLLAGTWGAVAALVLAVLSLGSVLMELAFRPNPIRAVLPKGSSQNVWAKVPPAGEVKTRVVIMGHLDSHRTPLAFSTDGWLRLFKTLIPLGLLSSVLLVILFAIGIGSPAIALRIASLPFTLLLLGVFALTVQADLTPFTAGANDNASAVGIILNVAERLLKEPLNRTEVWAVLSGCEEVGCYGADTFARAHKGDLGDAAWITLDSMASRNSKPAYLTKETFLLTAASDPGLLELAGRAAAAHPELGAEARAFAGAYTEGAIAQMHGFRVLTLTTFGAEGALTEWHRPTDTVANVDAKTLADCEAFLWALLRQVDAA